MFSEMVRREGGGGSMELLFEVHFLFFKVPTAIHFKSPGIQNEQLNRI